MSFSSAISLPFTNFFTFSFLSFSFSSKFSASFLNFLPLTCFSKTESLLISFFFVNLQNKNLLEILKKMLRRKTLDNLTCPFCIPRHMEGISKHLILYPLQFYSFCSKLLKFNSFQKKKINTLRYDLNSSRSGFKSCPVTLQWI